MSLVSVVCCQVEFSATGCSLVKRSPTKCGVSDYNLASSTRRSPRHTRAVEPLKKGIEYFLWRINETM
jgi:hypothetical protein